MYAISPTTNSTQLLRDRARAEREKRRRLRLRQTADPKHGAYQSNPVAFCREILHENYTPDIERVMESVRDNAITIAESANAVGKTHGAARIAVWWYKCFPGSQVYTAAAPPISNLTKLLWGEIGSLTVNHPHLFQNDKVHHLNIERHPLSFVTGVAINQTGSPAQREAKFSGKHAPYLLFILDEADAIPPEVFKGIEACLSGGNCRLLCMYNPRSNEGPIQAMKDRGVSVIRLNALDHPNVMTGNDVIPGAVTRNKTLHRIHQWTRKPIEGMPGIGRFTPPEFLVGTTGVNEETGEAYLPLEPDERVIVAPEFSYMVIGQYPGMSVGVIYDVWVDKWDEYAATIPPEISHRIESSRDRIGGKMPGWEGKGNVDPQADYEPDTGPIYWVIDDGYVGQLDPNTETYTADSHPRVILLHQLKPDGRMVCFAEHWTVRHPHPDKDIEAVEAWGYPSPELVILGPGSAALGGIISERGYYKRTCTAKVEDSIKVFRGWLADDGNGFRRYQVHPRCKHYRAEFPKYRRNNNGRIIKQFDHGCDGGRYLAWVGRNGF